MDPTTVPVITAIEPQVRAKDRVSVFVDGAFALGLHIEVAESLGLAEGKRIDPAALEELAHREELRRARDAALRFLGVRARSRTEVRRRLERGGFEAAIIEEAMDSLASHGYLDDVEFSRQWVEARSEGRGLGSRRLAAELRQKGIEREVIGEALGQVDPALEVEQATGLAQKRQSQLKGEEPRAAKRKIAAYLQRRGYSWEVCSQALARVFRDDDEPFPCS
jgi:regulatory protein